MEGSKKFLAMAGLIVLIGLAVVFVSKGVSGKRAQMPADVKNQTVKMVEVDTNAAIDVPRGEIIAGGQDKETGYFKNPKTGKYSLASPVACISCAKMIAAAPAPVLDRANLPAEALAAAEKKALEALANYTCPLCKNKAYPSAP